MVGSFYVQSNHVSFLSALMGIPLGFLTTSILINHDQIFFDAYQKAGKRSFTVTVGRKSAMATSFILTLFSYSIIIAGIAGKILPATTALVLLTLPLFVVQVRLYQTPAQSPLHYVKLTQSTFALSVLFGLLLALGLMLG